MAENDRLPYMPKYGHEFYGDDKVLVMDFAQKGMYDELLWRQWQNGSVPGELELLRCMLKPAMHEMRSWRVFVEMIDLLFPLVDGDPYSRQNLKLERVRANSIRVLRAKSLGGKKGAETRRELQESTKTDGTVLHKGKGEGKGRVLPSTKKVLCASSENWLTPYLDAWTAKAGNGSKPIPGKMAKYLGPLHTEFGDDQVLARFRYYLAQTKPDYLSVAKFSETYGSWDGESPEPGLDGLNT